jgi:hypothetical protein
MSHVYSMGSRCKIHLFPTSKKVNYTVLTISSLSQSKKTYGNSIPKNVNAMMLLVAVLFNQSITVRLRSHVLCAALLRQQERFLVCM